MEPKKLKVKEKKKKANTFSQKIKEVEKERDQYLAYAQRCKADFLNYKDKEGKRLRAFIDYEKEDWVLELLSILDQFERAGKEAPKKKQCSTFIEGFFQIKKYFGDFLEKQGIKEVETHIGKTFDPNFEEAIEIIEDKEKKDGTILEIIQKGYRYNKKIIRPTRVKVSKNNNQ